MRKKLEGKKNDKQRGKKKRHGEQRKEMRRESCVGMQPVVCQNSKEKIQIFKETYQIIIIKKSYPKRQTLLPPFPCQSSFPLSQLLPLVLTGNFGPTYPAAQQMRQQPVEREHSDEWHSTCFLTRVDNLSLFFYEKKIKFIAELWKWNENRPSKFNCGNLGQGHEIKSNDKK